MQSTICHNPYFNRWFSAINTYVRTNKALANVTILILIDGFLQYLKSGHTKVWYNVTILILIDGFLQ